MIRRFNKNDIGEVMKIWLNSNVQAHSFIMGRKLSYGKRDDSTGRSIYL